MNNNKHFIGIDVSKQTLDIAIHKQEQHLGHITLSNDLKAIATSLKGIGPVTACQMILSSGEFTKIQTGKQLACYCGVVPFEDSSGTSVRARSKVSHWANKKLKKYLHMAALSAIQGPGELQTYYERQLAKGKHKLSLLNAVRNKLVLRVCACIRNNQRYDPAYSYQAA